MKISDHSDFNGMISKDLTNIMIHKKNDYAMIVSSNIGGDKHYQGCGQKRVYSKIFLLISKLAVASTRGLDSCASTDQSPMKDSAFDPFKTGGTEKSWASSKIKTFIRKKDERASFLEKQQARQNGIPETLPKKDFASTYKKGSVRNRNCSFKSKPMLEDDLGE